MVESGDYVDIRFQDEPRWKKPVGIYWLQAAAVALTSDVEDRQIAPYRIPSLLGAMLAAWAVAWAGSAMLGSRVGFLGGAIMGATFLLSTEAGIAKTDAMLCGATTLAMAALARIYMATRGGRAARTAAQIPVLGGTGPVDPDQGADRVPGHRPGGHRRVDLGSERQMAVPAGLGLGPAACRPDGRTVGHRHHHRHRRRLLARGHRRRSGAQDRGRARKPFGLPWHVSVAGAPAVLPLDPAAARRRLDGMEPTGRAGDPVPGVLGAAGLADVRTGADQAVALHPADLRRAGASGRRRPGPAHRQGVAHHGARPWRCSRRS